MITQERLKHLVRYNPETGVFTALKSRGVNVKCGDVLGTLNKGYLRFAIDGKNYPAHRLAFLYVYGVSPKEIDHINGIKNDNRIINLRKCTRSQNTGNTGLRSTNTSGERGVYWDKSREKWYVQVCINGNKKQFGRFTDFDKAVLVARQARMDSFGEFFYI